MLKKPSLSEAFSKESWQHLSNDAGWTWEENGWATKAGYVENFIPKHFHKQLGSGLSPHISLYFQGFQGSKLLYGCLVIWPSSLCLRPMQEFSGFKIDIQDQWL